MLNGHEPVPAVVRSWDSEAQAFADAIMDHRAGYWLAAEIAKRIVGAAVTDDARKRAQKQLANLAHCSVAYVRQLIQLADAFPTDARYPDVAQSVYRACLRAAHQTKQPATRVLDLALRHNWHVRRIMALGREHDAIYKASGQCIACGGTLRFYRRGTAGLMIPCPGCLADAKHERRTLLDAFVIVGPLG
jgi:hypothetical protein